MSKITEAVAGLLGLPGVEVDAVEQEADGSWAVHVVTAPGRPACCPGCGRPAGRVKERTGHTMCHLVVLPVRVTWHKVKFWCDEDACERAVFCEGGPVVGRGGTVSEPAKDTMGHLIGDWMVPASRVAGAAGVSWHTAHRGFVGVAAGAGIVVTETKADTEPAIPAAGAGVDPGVGIRAGAGAGTGANPGTGAEPSTGTGSDTGVKRVLGPVRPQCRPGPAGR